MSNNKSDYIEALEDFTFEIENKICNKFFKQKTNYYEPSAIGKDVFLYDNQIKICWYGEYEKIKLSIDIDELKKDTWFDSITVIIELGQINTNIPIEQIDNNWTKYDITFVDLDKISNYKNHVYFYNKSKLICSKNVKI
jgi:hypothetical protein